MAPDRDTSATPPDDAVAALEAARAWAEQRAFLLYEGKAVAHRSCGVAIAETFAATVGPTSACAAAA